ncbi:MAG TPA: tetratricopeptide repeat protein [Pirellulales bacterium]|nr:tetratricopeptide repeat protein [Pirellulales bacterium]
MPQPHQSKLPAQSPPAIGGWQSAGFLALVGVLLIAGLVLLIYWPVVHGGFIMDDDLLLTDNALVKAPDGLYRMWLTREPVDYWPLTNSSFWAEWRLWGMNSTGYHVTNLLLHIINSLLVWLLLKRLAIRGAFLAALLFAVHPVNIESVAWIAERKNVLSMLFFLLSILSYLKAERLVNRWYWFSLMAFALAMLSKGSVAILPLLLLVIAWWQRGRVTAGDVRLVAPFFLVAIALTGVNIWFQTHGAETAIRNVTFDQRLAGAGAVVWFYLYKALWPMNLAFIYPQWDIQTSNLLWWLPLASVVAVTIVLLRACLSQQEKLSRKGWSGHLLFGWGVFIVALLPMLGFVDVGFMRYSLVADHYEYIALIPVVGLVAAAVDYCYGRAAAAARPVIAGGAFAVVAALAWLSWNQSQLYANSIALYEATIKINPDSWLVHTNLSIDLNDAGQLPQALAHAQEALRLQPDYAEAHNALGLILAQLGKPAEAIDQYHQALNLKPNFAEAYCNLGAAYGMQGQLLQAIDYLERAVQLKPYFFEAQCDLARALAGVGRLREAATQYDEALRLKPNSPEAEFGLARTYAAMNRSADAQTAAQKAIELARSNGQPELVKQIETWLTNYNTTQ